MRLQKEERCYGEDRHCHQDSKSALFACNLSKPTYEKSTKNRGHHPYKVKCRNQGIKGIKLRAQEGKHYLPITHIIEKIMVNHYQPCGHKENEGEGKREKN